MMSQAVVVGGHPGYIAGFFVIWICILTAQRILLLPLISSRRGVSSSRSGVEGFPKAASVVDQPRVLGNGSVAPRLRADRGLSPRGCGLTDNTRFLWCQPPFIS